MKGDKVKIVRDSYYYEQCPETEGTIVVSCFEDKPDNHDSKYEYSKYEYKGQWHTLDDSFYYIVEFTDGYINCYRDEDLELTWISKTLLGQLL